MAIISTDTGYTDQELEDSQNIPINEIDEYILLGNKDGPYFVKEYNVKRVIWLTTEVEETKFKIDLPKEIKRTTKYIADNPHNRITNIIHDTISIIDESIERKERVLIHCTQGVSRSASLVIGYLIIRRKMTAINALRFVEKSRCCVWPNKGFWEELQELELSIKFDL